MLHQVDRQASKLIPMSLPALPLDPLVSVIIASYNHGRYLDQTIESVLSQTYQHFELIICDDGSTDSSRSIACGWAERDSRIRLVFQDNAGQASAWNNAVRHSKGDLVSFLDSDDVFDPDKLRRVVDTARARDNAGVILHPVRPISQSGRVIGPPTPPKIDDGWIAERAMRSGGWRTWSISSGICLRRSVADEVFPIPEDYRSSPDFYVCAISQFVTEFAVLRESLALHRLHGENAGGGIRLGESAQRDLVEHAVMTTKMMGSYLREHFGPDVAARLNPDHIYDWYWEQFLALYVLERRPPEVFGYVRRQLLDHVSNKRRRATWWLLTGCPSIAGIRLLSLYWISRHWWLWTKFTLDRVRRRGAD